MSNDNSKRDFGDDGIVKSPTHTTITRIIGYGMPNGKIVKAPVEVWLTALITSLDMRFVSESVLPIVEKLNMDLAITELSDGMALVHKPILGVDH